MLLESFDTIGPASNTIPKMNELETLRQQLAVAVEEKNALSAQLAATLGQEISFSLTTADSIVHADRTEENIILAQMKEALTRGKELFDENVSLKCQLAAAQVHSVEKRRLEAELQRIKSHWETFNKLSVGPKKQESTANATDGRTTEMLQQETEVNRLLKEEKEAITQEKLKLKMENDQLLKRIDSFQGNHAIEMCRLKGEIDNLKLENGRLTSINHENRQLKSENERLAKELQYGHRNAQEIIRLQQENRKMMADVRQLSEIASGLDGVRETNRVIMEENEKLRLEVLRLNNELTLAYQRIKHLSDECIKLQGDFGQLKNDNQCLLADNAKLKSKLDCVEEENRLLLGENYVLKQESADQAKAKAVAYQKKIIGFQTALKNMAAKVSQLKIDCGETKQELKAINCGISIDSLVDKSSTEKWASELAKILSRRGSCHGEAQNTTSDQMDVSEKPQLSELDYACKFVQVTEQHDALKKKHRELCLTLLKVKARMSKPKKDRFTQGLKETLPISPKEKDQNSIEGT